MTDHEQREQDQAQPPAAAGDEDLSGAKVQQAQDEAGIAGEPQPAEEDGSD